MSPYDDEDDWVGTPPEGRHSRDRANPEFWRRQPPLTIAAGGLVLLIIIVIVAAILR